MRKLLREVLIGSSFALAGESMTRSGGLNPVGMADVAFRQFFHSHAIVTADTRPVIGSVQARFEQITLIERPVVAVGAQGRFPADRAVVVAALTHYIFTAMEIPGQLAVINMFCQGIDNFFMGHLHGRVFFRQKPDGDTVRDLVGRKAEGNIGRIRPEIVQRIKFRPDRCQNLRRGSGVADIAGMFRQAALFHEPMTSGAGRFCFLDLMAADAAVIGLRLVHGFLESDSVAPIATGQAVALFAP